MENKQKIRALRKVVRNIHEDISIEMEMASAMDGSGECGKFYIKSIYEGARERMADILEILKVPIKEIHAELDKYSIIEEPFTHNQIYGYDEIPPAYYDLCGILELVEVL